MPENLNRQIKRRTSVAGHVWFMGSAWQERSRRLFAPAGAVEKQWHQE